MVITMANPLRDLTADELEYECDNCENEFGCGDCSIMEERERRKELHIREVNEGQDRDVYHNGSIIKGGGVSRPEWMDNDTWGEYRMSAEYAHEVSCQGFDEPDDYDEYYD